MRVSVSILLAVIILSCVTGCDGESPETTAYRTAVEQLQGEVRQLQHQAGTSSAILNITTIALVITGCSLGVALFVLRGTARRR